jgi:malate synthase
VLGEELDMIKSLVGEKQFSNGKYHEAATLFDELTTNDQFVEFLTLRGYEKLI